jgi:hypothetical protein
MSTNPREVYYDININNQSSIGTTSQILNFNEARNKPLVNKAGLYSLSIVRFELDTYSLPTFIPDIEKFPNTDPDLMIQTVTLDYGAFSTQPKNLKWKPTNLHIAKPPNLSVSRPDQEDSEYYYGNSFRHYCDLVNTAFEALTAELKTLAGATLDDLKAPKMIWNDENQTCSILAQEEFYNWSKVNHVGIYFNRSLYANFTSLPAVKNYNNPLNKIYKIYMKDDYSTKIIVLDPLLDNVTEKFIKTDQEFSTISNWSPVAGIVFMSSNLPIVPTEVSAPYNYYNGILLTNSASQLKQRIITDMVANDMCYKPNLLYTPSAEYRFIDMTGDGAINEVDISVYWRDRSGLLHPFYLQSGSNCSIKILFKLK